MTESSFSNEIAKRIPKKDLGYLCSEEMSDAYSYAVQKNWKSFKDFFSDEKINLLNPENNCRIDVKGNTAFHLAAYYRQPEILRFLLDSLKPYQRIPALRMKNTTGNTPLHEAAYVGDVTIAIIIMSVAEVEDDHCGNREPLINETNDLGETPVFRAASLGNTDLLKYFLIERGDISMDDHIHNDKGDKGDKFSILHMAVINKHFDTGIWLLKQKRELANEKGERGMTVLQLMATMPTSFKSHCRLGSFKSLIYSILPEPDFEDCKPKDNETANEPRDLESCQLVRTRLLSYISPALSRIWFAVWKFLAEWKGIHDIWENKKMNVSAEKLAEMLAEKDDSWKGSHPIMDKIVCTRAADDPEERSAKANENISREKDTGEQINEKAVYTPLLMAASEGITEIVEKIIRWHPQAVEHVSVDENNILCLAVKNRHEKIYKIIKRQGVLERLIDIIDKEGNTVLHYAADHCKGGSQPGFAMQLKEDLRWFERVAKKIPHWYTMHTNQKKQTAFQKLEDEHKELLKNARTWIKETAQSCSSVAVLVATVVFAAAYTVPGGIDDRGLPRFLHEPVFLFFTIMDVISLASSLSSVVMFLSILTSPCELWDFRRSLPRKLMVGFGLLFFSLATTMLAFSATILLNIQLKEQSWTSSLTYGAAFFPVSIFALMQFPLYLAVKSCLGYFCKKAKKLIPNKLLNLCTGKIRKGFFIRK